MVVQAFCVRPVCDMWGKRGSWGSMCVVASVSADSRIMIDIDWRVFG